MIVKAKEDRPNTGGLIADLSDLAENDDELTGESTPIIEKKIEVKAETPDEGTSALDSLVSESTDPVGEDDSELAELFNADPILSALKKMKIEVPQALEALRAIGKKPSMAPTDPNEGNTVGDKKGPDANDIPPPPGAKSGVEA